MLNDDEEVHPGGLLWSRERFADPKVDFISGPYCPGGVRLRQSGCREEFLPVIGWMEADNQALEYGRDYDGVMMGSNAVMRELRPAVSRVVTTSLGRVGTPGGKRMQAGLLRSD